jgi:hypothetical protein
LSDIFREVDEEVRQERAKGLWKKYGIYVIGLALLVVVLVGGYKGWQYYSLQQLEKAGAQYLENVALIDDGKDAQALEAFQALSEKGSSGFFLLSKFQQAGLLAKLGKNGEAIALYDELAGKTALEDSLRNLARFRAALLLSNTASFKEVDDRIGKLATTGNPWRQSAQEILAITAFRNGDLIKAEEIFNVLSTEPETPNALRTRAAAMISIITPQLPAQTPKTQETKPDAQ